ncbi:MAG: alpha/beta hydrolase [Candidatus Absconditabacterales bacterium]
MGLKEKTDFPKGVEREIKLDGINLKIVEMENAKQVVIFCPGLPESSGYNDGIIKYISNEYNISCIYPQYKGTWQSDGVFLNESPSKDIESIIQNIRGGKIIKNSNTPITLIGSSFGGGIALSLSWNNDISKIIALSPLTVNSNNVDRDGLFQYIKNQRPEYRVDDKGYERLKSGKLIKIPNKYPEGKVVIGAISGDPEINYKELSRESIRKSATFLENITLEKNEKKHLSWSVLNRSDKSIKDAIFKSLDIPNNR